MCYTPISVVKAAIHVSTRILIVYSVCCVEIVHMHVYYAGRLK